MPRQSNGTYLPPANTAAVSGTSISSTAYNTLETDLGNEITNSLDRGGRSAMTAALPMGGQKITGMADPVATTDGATKNYVDTSTSAFFSTGDVKFTLKTAADSGWLLFDDGTFGSASSGSSNSNSANNLALFNLFFNSLSDAASPLLTSGGGATTRAAQTNAATAWAANCRMSLPKTLGRALGVAGAGSGLTSRALGTNVGEETHLLIISETPNHNHTASVTDPGHNHLVGIGSGTGPSGSFPPAPGASRAGSGSSDSSTTGISVSIGNKGGDLPHNNMQPTFFLNAMVKI